MGDLDLPYTGGNFLFSEAYCRFLRKIVALRIFGLPVDDIARLLKIEKKLLQLLRVDSASDSKTWYLDSCGENDSQATRLMLTGYDIGSYVTSAGVQFSLDFSERSRELFSSAEMGEDVRKVFALYQKHREKLVDRMMEERPVIEDALLQMLDLCDVKD